MAELPKEAKEALERRARQYRAVVAVPEFKDVYLDSLRHACRLPDIGVRCGALQMLAHLVTQADTLGNVLTEGTNNGDPR